MRGYKFLTADMRSGAGDEPPWEIGIKRTIPKDRPIVICEYGYHASPTLWDALKYAHGAVACVVRTGKVVERRGDKWVSASATVVKAVNVERELRLFAADCAERVLPIYERLYPKDNRPRKAIQAARDFIQGRIPASDLDAAGTAARAAAWDAAGTAAWAVARAVAWDVARDAAWDAAGTAARAAAQAAAWDAAGTAARAAAQAAAWDAAGAVARAAARASESTWQREHFDAVVLALLK